ncbi:hypothetical protein HZA97_01020 [Candidatus Woesearchaeota archaeon]|nr:hypothetical protein [Candidatus Woesearchaeota archaeon]
MKKTLTQIVAALAISFSTLSCNPVTNLPSVVLYPMNTLSIGEYSGVTRPLRQVINDQATFENLWTETVSITFPKPQLPEVDFNKNSVVAVYIGELSHSDGGNLKLVHSIEDIGDAVEIYLKPKNSETPSPPQSEIAVPALSQPYQLVKTEKINKKVVWIDWKGRSSE